MQLEHANVTVRDPRATADLLGRIFDWHVRWEGPALGGGHTVHVGTDDSYVALYRTPEPGEDAERYRVGSLNHLGVVVDDLDRIERRVRAEGIEPFSFSDYEPGRRFYFLDPDEIEYEVVSYAGP